jgi:hypothetical protein
MGTIRSVFSDRLPQMRMNAEASLQPFGSQVQESPAIRCYSSCYSNSAVLFAGVHLSSRTIYRTLLLVVRSLANNKRTAANLGPRGSD